MPEKLSGALYPWDKQKAVLQSASELSQVAKCMDVHRDQGNQLSPFRWAQVESDKLQLMSGHIGIQGEWEKVTTGEHEISLL